MIISHEMMVSETGLLFQEGVEYRMNPKGNEGLRKTLGKAKGPGGGSICLCSGPP
jgi:hypothetical protein